MPLEAIGPPVFSQGSDILLEIGYLQSALGKNRSLCGLLLRGLYCSTERDVPTVCSRPRASHSQPNALATARHCLMETVSSPIRSARKTPALSLQTSQRSFGKPLFYILTSHTGKQKNMNLPARILARAGACFVGLSVLLQPF